MLPTMNREEPFFHKLERTLCIEKALMKYLALASVFVFGLIIGRWSGQSSQEKNTHEQNIKKEMPLSSSNLKNCPNPSNQEVATTPQKKQKIIETKSPQEAAKESKNSKFIRTESKLLNKKIERLFGHLMQEMQHGQIDAQNRLFNKMKLLAPKHERVFQAKTIFQQDDGDWNGAYQTLKECAETLPTSIYCLKRLANIRSSTLDDKIKYGRACLKLDNNNLSCLVDLAIALKSRGLFQEAKSYFEQALSSSQNGQEYSRDYILLQYGMTLESMGLYTKATNAFAEACDLNMRVACLKLENR